MSKRQTLLALAWCAGLPAMPAVAETLSLEQAIELAVQQDPRISEKEHMVDYARALLKEAQGSDDLTIKINSFIGLVPGLGGGYFTGDCPAGGGGSCDVRDDRFTLEQGISLWEYISFSFIVPFNTFGKIEHYSEAARANIKVVQGDVRLQRARTIEDTSRAYFGYLTARDSKLFLDDVRKTVDDAEKLVKDWLDKGEGDVAQSDLYALRAGSALIENYKFQAEGLERVAMAGLKMLTGLEQIELLDRGIRPLPAPNATLEELQGAAMENRPEIMQLKEGLKARRELVAAKKAMLRPNLYAGFGGLISYSPGRDRLDNPHISDPFNDWGTSPLVGLRWDYQKGSQMARAEQAQAELDALVSKAALAQKGIPFEVAEQYHQAMGYFEAVRRLRDASQNGRRWMISSYADFEAGVEEAEKVMTALQAYVLAHTEYLRTAYDYNMYVVKLRQVTGAYE